MLFRVAPFVAEYAVVTVTVRVPVVASVSASQLYAGMTGGGVGQFLVIVIVAVSVVASPFTRASAIFVMVLTPH